MITNHTLHVRPAANVLAITLLAVLAAAQSHVCVGQELSASAPAEQLPPAEGAQLNSAEFKQNCEPVPSDEPLFTLTTDIRPKTPRDGQVVPDKDLPFNCAGVKPVQQRMMSLDLSCDTCQPGYSNLLNMARFCHKPLYFNDDCLERCGVEQCCCQSCRSAMCFYGGALLMPVRACCVCPCTCVPSGGCCQ